MLDFFRRHQRYFFIVITVVIVISFSFFGTYDTLSNSSFREQVAFTNVVGKDVTRHELDEMVTFLSTDAHDKLIFGGAWGPNFLNDGVLRKDFLETGLAVQLVNGYAQEVQRDLVARLDKEKRFNLYVHPEARFIGMETAWNYFSPDMTSYYHVLRVAQDPMSPDALQARIALFLMERQFPSSLMRQVLRYQEKQYSWLAPDRNLDYTDLSLFGYHTVEDWFGPRFIRLAAEFIMNAAVIAEQKGYEVSKADAIADLIRNADLSFKQNARNPNVGVATGQEYYNEQLHRLGMDQNTAAKVWGQVMLFRRLFQDMGNSVFVDPYTFKTLDAYAFESVDGELFRLPKDVRLTSFRALQKFEIYLDAISKRSDAEKAKLSLPTEFLSAADISKKTPELVERSYLLEIAQTDKKAIESNISVKDTWNWEVSDAGWELLKRQFPELGTAKGATREERFAALDNLDDKTRGRVDNFARGSIVDEHPEWLAKAIQEAPEARQVVNLHAKGGGNQLFAGLQNGEQLMALLDAAPLADEDVATLKPAAKAAADKLARYTADNSTYYRISVIERSAQPQILTFAAADKQGILDKIVDAKLEAYYLKMRESDPKAFQNEDKGWKPFADVKERIAERYFESVLKGIRTAYASAMPADKVPAEMIADYAATLRFFPYVNEIKAKVVNDPAQVALLTIIPKAAESEKLGLPVSAPLADQWKMERAPYQITRSSAENLLDKSEVFALADDAWTAVNTPANGEMNFFHVAHKGNQADGKAVASSVTKARQVLSDDAQQRLMAHVLQRIKDKQAMSLEYLNVNADGSPMN